MLRVLTDRGTEYCGKVDDHAYQLFLAIENIDHSKTKARSPQTNGICERFHKTMKHEFYDIAFRKKIYRTLEELQNDVNEWIDKYNNLRPHSGRYCDGKTPMQTFNEAKAIALEKQLEQNFEACEEQIQPADYRNASQEAVRYEVGTATSTMQVRSKITQGAQCEELEKNSNLSDNISVG